MLTVRRMATAGPDGLSWEVLDGSGAVVAAAPTQTGAERLAFLLDARAATAPATLAVAGVPVAFGRTRPTMPERLPAALVAAAGAAPVSVPGPFPAPEPRAVAAVPAVLGRDRWEVEGATVEVLPGGRFRVTFPRRPRLEVRDSLKAAGFRWDGTAGCWTGARLPVRFSPVAPAGARS